MHSAHHDYNTNKQISEDKVSQKDKDHSKPLAVGTLV